MTTEPVPPGAATVPRWTLADRFRKVRRDVADMSQADFAAKIGVSDKAYAQWESNRGKPRDLIAVARRIQILTGVPATWLLGMDEPPEPDMAGSTNTGGVKGS